MIVVHLGGNDLVTTAQGKLMKSMKRDLCYLASVFPTTFIVWSDILPQMSWRGLESNPLNLGNMNNKRKRINRVGRQIVRNLSKGRAIIHEIDEKISSLISHDGVHLAPVGNDIFLNTMSEGVSSFFKKDDMHVFDSNK